ncbi:MAG: hypothetical protein ACLR17_14830 [Enterobacteriaceae bacterium]
MRSTASGYSATQRSSPGAAQSACPGYRPDDSYAQHRLPEALYLRRA